MMKNIITLVKISLIMMFRSEASIKTKKIKKSILFIIIGLCFLPLIIGFAMGARSIYSVFDALGQGEMMIALVLATSGLIVFLFGIFYIISTFYIAKDIPNYLSMPLRPTDIILSRFVMVLLYEYFTLAIFLVPIFIGIGMAGTFHWLFYVISLLVFLILPILPLSFGSIIIIFMMMGSKKAINKDRFSTISGLLVLVISLGFGLMGQNLFSPMEDPAQLEQMILTGEISGVETVASYFPGIIQATRAIYQIQVLDLLLYIIIAAVSLIIFIYTAKHFYFKGLLGMTQQSAKRKIPKNQSAMFKQKNKVWTYTLKELRLLFRTPIYLMNLAIMDFIMPLFLIVPILTSVPSDQIGAFDEIKNMIQNTEYLPMVLGIGFAIFVFISAMNGITATCISREGRQLYFMQYIPMKYGQQIRGKIYSGMVVSLFASTLLVLIVSIFLSFSWWLTLILFIIGFNGVTFTRLTGVMIDIHRPKLHWDDEQKAVKQNMNLLINMILGIGLAVIAFLIPLNIPLTLWMAILIYVIGFFGLNVLLYVLLMKHTSKKLAKL